MLYRKFGKTNEMVSTLGFGCMRLPLLPGGDPSQIDENLAVKLVRYAIEKSIAQPVVVECGECETHCPQGISIPQELINVTAIFEKAK